MGITPPIISSSELYSDMNYPLVLSDILGYYSTHHLFIRTSFRYELRSELQLLLNRMSHYNSNGSYLNYLGTTGVTMVIHLYHHGCMICSLSQSILESVKELASLLYNEMYNFCSQQLDNCSELDPYQLVTTLLC